VKIAAILWDGFSKIEGELILGPDTLSFVLIDFAKTDLEFELRFDEVSDIDIHEVFGLPDLGIQINSKLNKQNVFIVEDPKAVRRTILHSARKFQLKKI